MGQEGNRPHGILVDPVKEVGEVADFGDSARRSQPEEVVGGRVGGAGEPEVVAGIDFQIDRLGRAGRAELGERAVAGDARDGKVGQPREPYIPGRPVHHLLDGHERRGCRVRRQQAAVFETIKGGPMRRLGRPAALPPPQ